MISFFKSYLKSMRLYYAFVTGMAGWVGLAYYQAKTGTEIDYRYYITLMLLFLSWGVNQIVNDYLGLEEDRVNAPNRPMVSGELSAKWALAFSMVINLTMGALAISFLNIYSLIPLVLGLALNVVYEYAKGYGVWGNIAFGMMLTMTTFFGVMALDTGVNIVFQKEFLAIALMVFILNALLTYYTYFKDYPGDKEVNKRTIIVQLGPRKAAALGVYISIIPLITYLILRWTGVFSDDLSSSFIVTGSIAVVLHIINGIRFRRAPVGDASYFSLKGNFRAYAVGFTSLIAMVNPLLGIQLFAITYIFLGLFFDLHADPKG